MIAIIKLHDQLFAKEVNLLNEPDMDILQAFADQNNEPILLINQMEDLHRFNIDPKEVKKTS